MKDLRVIFMGTPEFAVPCLSMLIDEGLNVVAVVTQPDKPKGRGNKLVSPPVKEYAEKYGIDVLQPVKVRTPEYVELLKSYKPDIYITCAYGRILIKDVLDIPPLGCINVHGSLLPKYRGAAPIQWAIINGDKVTGITTMYTDEGMDTGDMLIKSEIEIDDYITGGEMHDRLSVLGADTLKKTLVKLMDGSLERIPQPSEGVTIAPIIDKETGRIDWSKPAKSVHNLVRGTDPWPGAFTFYKGARMRIWKTVVYNETGNAGIPGNILKVNKEGILIACGEGILKAIEIQFDSSKRMSVENYICGHSINEGEKLE